MRPGRERESLNTKQKKKYEPNREAAVIILWWIQTQHLQIIREVSIPSYLFLCWETTGRTYMAVHFQMSGLISLCANQHGAFLPLLLFPYLLPTSLSTLRKHQWPVCNNQSFFTSISNILHWQEFSINYTTGSYLLL